MFSLLHLQAAAQSGIVCSALFYALLLMSMSLCVKHVSQYNDRYFFLSLAIEVSGFSATSKTVILKWTRYPGASSYKIYVAHTCTPNSPFGSIQYGANVVIGSVNFLSPNTIYVFTIEALDNSGRQLSTATKELSTGESHFCPYLNCLITYYDIKNNTIKCVHYSSMWDPLADMNINFSIKKMGKTDQDDLSL